MAMRRRARLLLVLPALLALFLVTPTGCYLSRAGWEEAKILERRKPIGSLVADPRTPPAERTKLALVLDARRFAADSIGLKVKKSFTTYSRLERDTLVLVLSGAYRDTLRSYTWWFPIVGRVPYKGYFDFGAAKDAARDLERRGFDVNLRPAAAFSTLGWFNDPLVTSTLSEDTVDLANTVVHEVTHNTFYAKGQAPFNESFANFVGARGSEWFFRSRGQLGAAGEAARRWDDEKTLAAFWSGVYTSLDSAYRAHPGAARRAERIAARDTVYARARQTLVADVGPRLTTIPVAALGRTRFDNASLLARRVYRTDLALFDQIYDREGRDLRRTIARVIALAKSQPKTPFVAVRRWLGVPVTAADSSGS